MTPYVATMECGNHEDVRWVALRNALGVGLLATADGGQMSLSALPYSDEELGAVKHPHELPASTATVLCLSTGTLGVGSAGCGPQPQKQYVSRSEPFVFSCVFRPLNEKTADPAGVARESLPPRAKPVRYQRDTQGRASLVSSSPSISYSLNGGPQTAYANPFEVGEGGTLRVRSTGPGLLPFEGELTLAKPGHRGEWKIAAASSFEPGEGEAVHAIDGDSDTFWHSRWSGNEAKAPHWLVIDLGKPTPLKGIVYSARADSENGRVRDCEVYLSEDGKRWGAAPDGKARLRGSAEPQTILLGKPAVARFIKFIALNEIRGRAWATVAELDIVPAD
jgi:beta-galactosidase